MSKSTEVTECARHEIVAQVIASRRSVRRFLPDEVDVSLVRHLLAAASRAPSGTNMQPWRVHVLMGDARNRFCNVLCEAFDSDEPHIAERRYYPEPFFEPYLSRRRSVGWGLYGLLGIGRGELGRMKVQHRRNLVFFDAPVGLIFTIDRRLGIGSWLDYGMYLQNLMIAARSHGLDTCPQAAFVHWHRAIRRALPVGDDDEVVCGMALGRADETAPENQLHTERVGVDAFAIFHEV